MIIAHAGDATLGAVPEPPAFPGFVCGFDRATPDPMRRITERPEARTARRRDDRNGRG